MKFIGSQFYPCHSLKRSRRSFLLGLGALSAGIITSGCSSSEEITLKVSLLENSIPPQFLREFRQQLTESVNLKFQAETQIKSLFSLLENWQQQGQSKTENENWQQWFNRKQITISDLVTLGDYWLESAVSQQLIQPLDVEKLQAWKNLPSPWQNLVRRDQKGKLSQEGKIWGAPYRWGTTAIAYRRDKFKVLGWKPTDWSDLWREELRHRISILDQPREVIGLTLKKLGESYNEENLDQVPNLKQELIELNQQVKFYSSNFYLQPLVLGDTWLAVGWSSDIVSIQKRYQNIGAIVPVSGTAMWSDLWVQPAVSTTEDNQIQPVVDRWIDFCWSRKSAREISLLTDAASPIITDGEANKLDSETQEQSLLSVPSSIIERSEFLEPLPTKTLTQYQKLWEEMRQELV